MVSFVVIPQGNMDGGTKVLPHILYGAVIKFTRTTCKSFTKLTLLCHKVCSILSIHFLPSPQTLCDGGVKHLAEASELLTCCVPALRCRPQNGGLGVHRSGYHKDRSSRLLSRDLRGWWVGKFHPTVSAHPLVHRLLSWWWRWRSWFISLLPEPC
jgi:hypothetical protein